jgi:hypothetical protein
MSVAPFTASVVGRPLDRIDGPAKVTGTAAERMAARHLDRVIFR